jgi:hypothetical protein
LGRRRACAGWVWAGWVWGGQGRVFGDAQNETVGQTQIDRDEVSVDQAVFAHEPGEALVGAAGIGFGQIDVDAVVEVQVPAPPADAHGGRHALQQLRLGFQQGDQGACVRGRIVADHDEPIGKARGIRARDLRAFGVDHDEAALALPQGERDALFDAHEDRVGQAPFDGNAPHPGKPLEFGFGGVGIEREDGGAASRVEDGAQIARVGLHAAFDQNVAHG